MQAIPVKSLLIFSSILLFLFSNGQDSRLSQLLMIGKDYRYYQSPVKNQVDRGTCTAFAVAAAMEVFPGVPSDLSEQHLYAEVKTKGLVDRDTVYGGEFLKNYADLLKITGILHEEQMPYNPRNYIWADQDEPMEKFKDEIGHASLIGLLMGFIDFDNYKLSNKLYSYYEGAQAKNIQYIKTQLDLGTKAIPVTYIIYKPDWKDNSGKSTDAFNAENIYKVKQNGQWKPFSQAKMMDFSIADKIANDEVEIDLLDKDLDNYGGHAVVIVGYNSKGFIIKNSWSSDWADKGYAIISYDYHKLFAREIIILHSIYKNSALGDHVEYNPDIRLKSLPGHLLGRKTMQLSIFNASKGKMPELESMKFKVYEKSGVVGKKFIMESAAFLNELGSKSGYPTLVLTDNPGLDTEKEYIVTLEYKFKNSLIRSKTYAGVKWANLEYKESVSASLYFED